ncbi:hypothetical protein [Prochlorococcus sp. MIT 0916]|uniref:hypothetical protein n=1 Tax=Prochlorococcus sp. MIT 0916 TaxID=3082521 RepID=UPI0039B46D07
MEKETQWKKALDNLLIYNLYILILGSLFLAFSFVLSINGNSYFDILFQKLWYPLFIPSLSLFFTAILVEAVINSLFDRKNK